ncbi:WD40 repeat-like protein, partial [Rhizoctonia solani]
MELTQGLFSPGISSPNAAQTRIRASTSRRQRVWQFLRNPFSIVTSSQSAIEHATTLGPSSSHDSAPETNSQSAPTDFIHTSLQSADTLPYPPEPHSTHTLSEVSLPRSIGHIVVANAFNFHDDTSSAVENTVRAVLRESLQALKTNLADLGSAIDILLNLFDMTEQGAQTHGDYERYMIDLTKLCDSIVKHSGESLSPRVSNCIINVVTEVEQRANKISTGDLRNPQVLGNSRIYNGIVEQIREIVLLFQQLQCDFNDDLLNKWLEAFNPVRQAEYNSILARAVHRHECSQGTSDEILSQIDTWLNDPGQPAILWMTGLAGSGKTTIAYTLSERLERQNLLAASFFCTHGFTNCRDTARIIPTVAYQLARRSTLFHSTLADILCEAPDFESLSVEQQFQRFIQGPLELAYGSLTESFVVVVDGLEECTDTTGVESIYHLLGNVKLPLRVFITSRQQGHITLPQLVPDKDYLALDLSSIDPMSVQTDIACYFQNELAPMILSSIQLSQLIDQCDYSFVNAVYISRYINSGNHRSDVFERLQLVTQRKSNSVKKHVEISKSREAVLNCLWKEDVPNHKTEDVRAILQTILCVMKPTSMPVVIALAGISDSDRALAAFYLLESIIIQSEENCPTSVLELSFSDFVFDRNWPEPRLCDVVVQNQLLAERCFFVMEKELRFNICDIESSFIPDQQLEDLEGRIEKNISPSLAYACRSWGTHLALAAPSVVLEALLEQFIRFSLLFWLEVINLRQEVQTGIESLVKSKEWLDQQPPNGSALKVLVDDALEFLKVFKSSRASQSTSHIYISSLPFCPRTSSVYKNYWSQMRGLLKLKGTLMGDRQEDVAPTTWYIGSGVYSVAYSPNGTRIATGSQDGTVAILNSHDGTPLFNPLRAHREWVSAVAFSADGHFIASGSGDNNILVWDAYHGQLKSGPFEGHTGAICSISFSRDANLIVSGSRDGSIRVWSLHSASLVQGPLTVRSNPIRSVAFSPDSAFIACASDDHTINLWDWRNSVTKVSYKGHKNWVWSVAFTSDGTRLVSGSWDKTIRVWSTSSGLLLAGPFKGHTDWVYSVAVSPDNNQVASGSFDRTVRVWSINDGTLVAGPFIGHTGWIYSVAYSPDGAHLISGSQDGTIRVWNVASSAQQFVSDISSLSFSGTGASIFAKSNEDIVWVWDISSKNNASNHFNRMNDPHIPFPLSSPQARIQNDGHHTLQVVGIDGFMVFGSLEGQIDQLSSFALSNDKAHLITGWRDCTVQLWNLSPSRLATGPLYGHTGAVTAVALSLDGSRIASYSGEDHTVRVWIARSTAVNIVVPVISLPDLPDRHQSHPRVMKYWHIREDGWVVDDNSNQLLWIPEDISLRQMWLSPHAEFIVNENGLLRFPRHELLLGIRWSGCYVFR